MTFAGLKAGVAATFAAIGGCIGALFGGWSVGLTVLVSFMGIDYVTGLIVAAVFKNSPKTDTGALSSKIGFQGLLKKGCILIIMFIAAQLDNVLGSKFILTACLFAYIANEALSIIENFGLMGLYIPPVVTNAIDLLKKKGETDGNQN